MANPDHQSICDAISELAAALTKAGNCPDLPGKLMAFTESPNLSCHAVGLKMVADLVESAKNSPSSFTTYLADFVQALSAIAKTSEAKDGVRQMAVEVLLCILENTTMRKYHLDILEFASELVPILLKFMLTAEDDGDATKQDNSKLDADTSRNYDIGEKGLKRVTSKLEEENLKVTIFSFATKYFKRDELQHKLVAIMAIKQTFKYSNEEKKIALLKRVNDQLENQYWVTPNGVNQLENQYWVNQVSPNSKPKFQQSYAKVFLPVLVNFFDDSSPTVQSHVVAAFITFAKGTEKADLMPFADQFMERLLDKIKPEKPGMLRERCLKGIAVVAGVIEKEFMKYYSFVAPVIKKTIIESISKEEKTIRQNAIECLFEIGQSTEVEIFQADAHEVMQALLSMSSAGVKVDDCLRDFSTIFLSLCPTLKREFLPYLPHVIPNILKVLISKPQPSNHEKDDVEDMTFIVDGKCTSLSQIHKITEALRSLSTFVKVFGAQFEEYLVPVAQSLLSLLAFHFDKCLALAVFAKVIRIARELNPSDPAVRQRLSLWLGDLFENVFQVLTLHGDKFMMISDKTKGLNKCLRNAGPGVLDAQQVGDICKKVFALMEDVEISKDICDNRLSALRELIATVMLFHADLYLQTGAELCRKYIETHLEPNCTPDARAAALFVCGDVLKHLKDKGAPLWQPFASHLVESIDGSDPVTRNSNYRVRRAALLGLTQAAKCPQFPGELIQKAADQLVALLSNKLFRYSPPVKSVDEVIAALGAIVLHRSSCLQPSPEQFLHLWISNLPLKVDDEEGRRVHGDFVDLLVQKSPEVLGPQNANLPKLAKICASIYQTDLSTAKIDEGIRDFTKKIGFDVISSVGANFDEKLQKNLERICQDSQTMSDKSLMTPI